MDRFRAVSELGLLFCYGFFEFISGFCGKFEISIDFLKFEEILRKVLWWMEK